MNKRRVIKLFFSFASSIAAAVWLLRPTVINIDSIRKKEEAVTVFNDNILGIDEILSRVNKDIRRRYYE